MITEITTFQLQADASLADSGSPASKVICESLAPDFAAAGAHEVYYGQLIEKPKTGFIFVNWDSIDDRKKFISSPAHHAHIDHLNAILDPSTPSTTMHVPFAPTSNPSPALGSTANPQVGTTEIVFFYFPCTLIASEKSTIMSSFDKMRPVVAHSEALAIYDGWALETEIPNPGPQAEEGEKCQVFVNLVGWVDVDAHLRFQGSENFGQNIHHLLGLKHMRHSELNHARLFKVEGGK